MARSTALHAVLVVAAAAVVGSVPLPRSPSAGGSSLPPGVTLLSPRPAERIVTDALVISLAFDELPGQDCEICATLDGHGPQCLQAPSMGASGAIFRFGQGPIKRSDFTSHTLDLTVRGFQREVDSRQEERVYTESVEFTAVSFAAALPQRTAPRIVIDAFPFYDEMDVLELRLEELGRDVDVFVVAESPLTHSFLPKPLYLANAISSGDPRWARWANRIQTISVEPADLAALQRTNDTHSSEAAQRNLLASAVSGLLVTEYGHLGNDDIIVLVSDVDEVPSRSAMQSLRYSSGPLSRVTWISLAWHHYAFNYASRVIWGALDQSDLAETAMALTPDQLKASTATGGLLTLTMLRRAVRDQLPVPGAVYHLGGWHLQRFGSAAMVSSKLSASPFAHSLSLASSSFQDKKLGEDLLNAGIVMTYPNLKKPFITLTSAPFNWVSKAECSHWAGLTLPAAASMEWAERAKFWIVERPTVDSEATQSLRWSIIARDLRRSAALGEEAPISLVVTEKSHGVSGKVVNEECVISCSARLLATSERCRWSLALTPRVGKLVTEIAAERCLQQGRARNSTHGDIDKITLRFRVQRTAPLELNINGQHVFLGLSADFVSSNLLSAGAQASAEEHVGETCRRFISTDSGMCNSLRSQAQRLAQVLELLFVPIARSSVLVGDDEVPLVFSCDAPSLEVGHQWCSSNGVISQSSDASSPRLEGERHTGLDPQVNRRRYVNLHAPMHVTHCFRSFVTLAPGLHKAS